MDRHQVGRAADRVRGLGRALTGWPGRGQETSRRNALVATTACAARRRDRDDVEAFLALLPDQSAREASA